MIILDTHIWHWWVNQIPEKLPDDTIQLIEEADEVGVSAISCFEMAWLMKHGRINSKISYDEWFKLAGNENLITFLPVTPSIASKAVALPEHHKDPHDRIIIATAVLYNSLLISFDKIFPLYNELQGLLIGK
ncbi:MAG: type II toxin-antitoxin system VapC family toxin [Desulfamplus sp.]|nr:type II toxin-antitoxin system VapC family toxin [Desulfamplus sp.]